MRSLAWAVGLTLVGSLGGVLVASALLSFNDRIRLTIVPWLVSYAVGTLLGVALLVLLPEALAHLSARTVLASLLGGIMLFFLLEKLVLWRHCHTHDCEAHGMAAPMVIIGDADDYYAGTTVEQALAEIGAGGIGGGGGSGNLDGGTPTTIYGGTTGIDGGTP